MFKKLGLSVLSGSFFLFAPAFCRAQEIGQVECARSGDYVYLYSSMITFEIRTTLECGQQVDVTGRYEGYYGVRTAKGEIGYVPLDSLLLIKTAPGAKPALAPSKQPSREHIHYDSPTKPSDTSPIAVKTGVALVLPDSTPVHMKLLKAISSTNAEVGDVAQFEVTEDVVVDDLLIIAKGASATGVVNEAVTKKALGRGGRLSVLINSVKLANDRDALLRSGTERKGTSSTAGMVIPVMHGKDITFPVGMEFTAVVNGDTRLKRDSFHAAPAVDFPATAASTPNPHN